MRIRRRWQSTTPLQSSCPSQQHQIEGKQKNMVEARAGLHPNEFLSARPKYMNNQPQTLQRSDKKEQPATEAPSAGTKANGWIHPDRGLKPKEINRRPPNQTTLQEEEEESEEKAVCCKRSSDSDSTGSDAGSPLISSPREVSRWSEGEKAFPFKKRRGGYDWGEAGGETLEEKRKKMKSKVKRNISNKYKDEDDDDDDDDDDDYDDKEERTAAKNLVIRRKGRKAGGSLKRGSRCSRVNGRGWQCSRQTLVGYSLCEHHLGKARTKSIGNMIGIRRPATVAALGEPSRNNDDKGYDNDDDLNQPLLVKEATLVEEEQKEEVAWPLLPLIVVKKKKRGKRLGWKRLGNSLLGQAQQHPTM